jgi:hypothetical protein
VTHDRFRRSSCHGRKSGIRAALIDRAAFGHGGSR